MIPKDIPGSFCEFRFLLSHISTPSHTPLRHKPYTLGWCCRLHDPHEIRPYHILTRPWRRMRRVRHIIFGKPRPAAAMGPCAGHAGPERGSRRGGPLRPSRRELSMPCCAKQSRTGALPPVNRKPERLQMMECAFRRISTSRENTATVPLYAWFPALIESHYNLRRSV